MKTSSPKQAQTRSAVIVEIGSDWLKIAQTEPLKDGLAISRIHLEKFDSLGSGLSRVIAGAFAEQKFDKMPVIACVPRQMVNIRMMELPSTDPDEVVSMAEIQTAKQTPYSRDEIVCDCRITKGSRAGYTKVMMAIVQNSVVRERFHVLEEAGIEVERMSVTTEGILSWHARSQVPESEGSAVMLLDVDSFYAEFMVIGAGGLIFTRSILTGSNQLLNGTRDLSLIHI